MRALNFGSMNLDYVYEVDHFVQPGETLAARGRRIIPGGKGLNQSIALARAGAQVAHAGCVGQGGELLVRMLESEGVDVSLIGPVDEMQGHTVIQVTPNGENCILLYGGSNRCVTEAQIQRTLSAFEKGDWLILQNEVNGLPALVEGARRRGMRIALNPSPWDAALLEVNFGHLEWLLINEVEAAQITGSAEPETAFSLLRGKYPDLNVLITLGSAGSMAFWREDGAAASHREPAHPAKAVDTTAAGDTYTGYFIAALMDGLSVPDAMSRASRAAAISVTRHGAAPSIPQSEEVD